MDNIKKNDAGTYTVIATNTFGSEQCPATLMVTDKPEDMDDWAKSLKRT